ncbi:MAG: hypothetical protein [Caudoviricetes sp.]|nr:MAG: hypothetical protein [Caudoviricetes sp.]
MSMEKMRLWNELIEEDCPSLINYVEGQKAPFRICIPIDEFNGSPNVKSQAVKLLKDKWNLTLYDVDLGYGPTTMIILNKNKE